MNYGIVVCPGYESLVRFDRMIRRDAHSAEMIALEQDCLCCYFGDREDVKEADRAVME